MDRRLLLIPVLVVVGGLLLAWSQTRSTPLIVSGYIEADEIRVGSLVGGRVMETKVEEGSAVEQGELLVKLEPFNHAERLAEAQRELAASEERYRLLASGHRKESIAAAKSRLDQSETVYQQALAGPRKLEIAEAEELKRKLEALAEFNRLELNRIEELAKKRAASPEDLDQATTRMKQSIAELAAQQARVDLLHEGVRKEEIARAKAGMEEAKAQFEELVAGFREEEIAEAKAKADAVRARVASLEKELDELDIRSPSNCVVEAMDLQPGDLIPAGAPVVSLMDISRMWVRAYVPAERLGNVKLDGDLGIRVDGFPDRSFKGKVTYISRNAEYTPSNVQTPEERSQRVYRIKVMLTEGLELLRPGMTCDVLLEEEATQVSATGSSSSDGAASSGGFK